MVKSSRNSSAKEIDGDRRLAECFKRGVRLYNHDKNYDYAHVMFAECVLNDPGNLQFVEAMVRNLRANKPERKKAKFRLSRVGNRTLTKLLQQKAWGDVLRSGIALLKVDPWDVTTLHAMAEACAALHHNEVELVYLKQALDAEPKSVEVNRHCARSLGRMGQFDQAIACWHRVETLRGKDAEAAKMIACLAEQKIMHSGAHASVTKIKDVPAPEPIEQKMEQLVLSPQQRLEQAIADDPKNAANYLELADLLLCSNRLNAAEALLSRAVAACEERSELKERLNHLRQMRAEEQRVVAKNRTAEQQLINAPIRAPWLQLGLAASVLMLAIQVFPPFRAVAGRLIDFRHWSHFGWVVSNLVVLFGLIAARFRTQLIAVLKRRRTRQKHRLLTSQR